MTRAAVTCALCLLVLACGTAESPSDSETHFLRDCEDGCGDLACICGVCTTACDDTCGDVSPRATCRQSARSPLTCDDPSPPTSYCVLACAEDADCTATNPSWACIDGACGTPAPEPPDASTPASFPIRDAAPTVGAEGDGGDEVMGSVSVR